MNKWLENYQMKKLKIQMKNIIKIIKINNKKMNIQIILKNIKKLDLYLR